jgi:GT2 family glycosyltransferase
VPAVYAAEVLARVHEGSEVVNLKRFIFFLSQAHTRDLFSNPKNLFSAAPAAVMQNAEGGGSIAVTREAFFALGGFDETFVGWGGEDNEFWERAQTRRVWPYAYLPLLHLWHPPQPEKMNHARVTAALYEQRSGLPVAERVRELRARLAGQYSAGQGL